MLDQWRFVFFFFKSKFGRFFIELFSFQDIQDGNGGIFDNHDEFIYFWILT